MPSLSTTGDLVLSALRKDPVAWEKFKERELETEQRAAQCEAAGVRFEDSDHVFGPMSADSFPDVILSILRKDGKDHTYTDLAPLIMAARLEARKELKLPV